MLPVQIIRDYLVDLQCHPDSAETLAEGIVVALESEGFHFLHDPRGSKYIRDLKGVSR